MRPCLLTQTEALRAYLACRLYRLSSCENEILAPNNKRAMIFFLSQKNAALCKQRQAVD
jgi:hypothetical protein